jgi:hypothetical protein
MLAVVGSSPLWALARQGSARTAPHSARATPATLPPFHAASTSTVLARTNPLPAGPDVQFCEVVTPATSRNTAYPLTACRSANTCLTCSCPASRANFSVTYAHVAVHPQQQVGRLTSRLPSFSGRIVMLWVTLMIFLLLTHRKSSHSIDADPLHRDVKLTGDDERENHAGHRLTAPASGVGRAPDKNHLHLAAATPLPESVQLTSSRHCASGHAKDAHSPSWISSQRRSSSGLSSPSRSPSSPTSSA